MAGHQPIRRLRAGKPGRAVGAGDFYRSVAVEPRDFVVIRRSERWGKTYSRDSAAASLEKAEKRRLAEGESIERIARRVRSLERDGVAEVGQLPAPVVRHWREIKSTRLVITGERRIHMIKSHPEMADLMLELLATLTDPHEIHWDKNEPATTATFWRAIDAEGAYWLRASVRLAVAGSGEKSNSLLTAWQIRRRGYQAEVRTGRRVWEKEEGA